MGWQIVGNSIVVQLSNGCLIYCVKLRFQGQNEWLVFELVQIADLRACNQSSEWINLSFRFAVFFFTLSLVGMVSMFPAKMEGCSNIVRETDSERAREIHPACAGASLMTEWTIPTTCYRLPILYQLITKSTQEHWGVPCQTAVLQIDPSTCQRNITAREEDCKQRPASNELHNFLTGSKSHHRL